MEILAWVFGLIGFVLAASSYDRINKLEKELKRLGVLDRDFTSEDKE